MLQAFPPKAATQIAQLRSGFARLRAEVKNLNIRQQQQQVVFQQLQGQLASRDDLNARLASLQAEKDTFTEWCSLRSGGGALSGFMTSDACVKKSILRCFSNAWSHA